jgi:hypothetical protein
LILLTFYWVDILPNGISIRYIINRYSKTKEYFIEYDINEIVIKISKLMSEICESLEDGTYTSSLLKNEIDILNKK